MDEREACIGFSAFKGIGPLRFKLLFDYFGSADKAWSAPKETLLSIGLGEKTTERFVYFRNNFSIVHFLDELGRKQISIVTRIDTNYPEPLTQIADPPIALYIKGRLPAKLDRCIGVVGTRKPTAYGRQVSEQITRDLVQAGCTIISGLARGVDGIAHRTTLVEGGITIGVLGCGIDIIYPPEHKNLYFDIINSEGAVISEVPPGHTVMKGLFPARNRIISGLSRGVLVTEGAEDSGSLITASLALEQNRDVFAIPGPINSYLSAGPAKLIKQGAKLVTSTADILEELKLPSVTRRSNGQTGNGGSPQEQKIIEVLSSGTVHFDDIVKVTALTAADVGSILTILELNGTIRSLGEGKYTLL